MPKIPTFTAQGSIEQLQGSTTAPQIGLDQTLAVALAPATKILVDQKIVENDAQNQAEALKLENDFITDFIKVQENINTDEIMSVNKIVANKYLKDQSNLLINQYKSLATNNNVAVKFSNYALAETQKGIFRTDTQISKNIFKNLVSGYDKQKQQLLITADTDQSGIAKGTLKTDLEKLTIDTFQSQVSAPELKIMLQSIPNEIDLMDGSRDARQQPRKTLFLLKDKNYLPSLTLEQRNDLKEKAQGILAPIVQAQWRSHVDQINDGQDVEPFDLKLVSEVLPPEAATAMIQQESIFRDTADNVKIILSSSEKNVNEVVKGFVNEAKETHLYDKAKDIEKFYNSVLEQREKDIKNDPAEYTIRTNSDIKNLVQELENEQNEDIAASLSKELAIKIMESQTNIGIEKSNQKVMTNSMSSKFILDYKQAAKDNNVNLQDAMLQGLVTKYGELEDEALTQLMIAGLPQGAKFISAGFATQEDKMKFLSLDDPNVVTDLKKNLQDMGDTNISFQKMRTAIRQNPEFKDIENIIKRNVPFDPSDEIPVIEDVVDFLAKYGSNEFLNGDVKTFDTAAKVAVNLFTKNFEIEDTYYYPKTFIDSTTGKPILPLKIDRNKQMMEIIKDNYLPKLNLSTFSSKKEKITNEKLTEKMQYQMKENGEWRNSPDGKGFIFGIVLSGNSFGIVKNKNGNPLFFPADYDGNTVPGYNIVVDLDIETKKQQARGYLGYQEKINQKDFSLGKRPSEVPEEAFIDIEEEFKDTIK